MADERRITDIIRMDHDWFRGKFAALEQARGDGGDLPALWKELSDRLEVHAVAEETLFYPRLLKDDKDSVDDTEDAIRDHNEIRDAIRDSEAHTIGEDAWWKAVDDANKANTEHMEEEEEGPLREFDEFASPGEQAELATAFAAFERDHSGRRGISTADKDPDRYIEENA
jgi:hypothetical protein